MNKKEKIVYVIMIIVCIGLYCLIDGLINQAVYGDWTCEFKQCVDVKGQE